MPKKNTYLSSNGKRFFSLHFDQKKSRIFEHMPNVKCITCNIETLEMAASSTKANINFLNFCSNCQMVTHTRSHTNTEKKVRFRLKKNNLVACSFCCIFHWIHCYRRSESGNQVNLKIDMRIIVTKAKEMYTLMFVSKKNPIVFNSEIFRFFLRLYEQWTFENRFDKRTKPNMMREIEVFLKIYW